MAEVTFAIGAVADLATGKEVQQAVDSGISRLERRMHDKDRGVRLRPADSLSLPVAATGTYYLDLGTPAPGTLWWLQELLVCVDDNRTAPAGTVAVAYCGGSPNQAGNNVTDVPSLAQLIRPGTAVPAVWTFGGEVWPVKDGERLSVIVYAPTTALTTIAAVATVDQVAANTVSWNRS